MKRKRRNSSSKSLYYDKNAQIGYNILRNIGDVEALGTAILSHDKYIAKQIDLSYEDIRKANAEEDEWEKIKKQDREYFDALLSAPYSMSAGIGVNPAGVKLAEVGTAYMHVKNRDIPNMPEDYGVSDFLKDQWNSYFGELNKLLAEDAKGYQVRAANDKKLIRDYLDSLDKLDEIDYIDGRVRELDLLLGLSDLTPGQINNINEEKLLLKGRRSLLEKEYLLLAPNRKLLEDTVNQSGFGAGWDALMSGNGIFGSKFAESTVGKTTAGHDELNDARRFIYDLGDGTRSREETRQMLLRAYKEYGLLNKGWQAIIDENERDEKYHKDKISKWFQGRSDKTGINFTDPDTYLFKMPGIIGGSTSSFMKLAPAMISGILGATVAGVASGGTALAAAGLGALGSYSMNRAAGISENNAEVALAAKERIKERTGLNDKDVDDIISGKLDDPKKLRLVTENIRDVENLFNKDMAATTWDAAITAALEAVPIGAIARLNKYVRGTKVGKKVIEQMSKNPEIAQSFVSKFGSDFAKGFDVGMTVGPLAAVGSGAVNATVGRGLRSAGNKLGTLITRRTDGTLIGAIGEELSQRMSMLGKASSLINPGEAAVAAAERRGLRSRYMRGIGGRLIKAGISEGIEEGKLHINAEDFKNASSDPKLMNTLDIAFTDMINGITSGAYILGIPLDGLGIINIKDQDLLLEIKGGMLGGWGLTAFVNVAESAIPYIRLKKAVDIAAEQLLTDKLSSTAQRKQYESWLKRGLLSPNQNEILLAFENLRNRNESFKLTYRKDMISNELIDEAEKKYNRIIKLASSPLILKAASDAGINVRSWKNPSSWRSNSEYHKFVATVAVALDRISEVLQNRNNAVDDLQKARQEVSAKLSISDENLEDVLSYLQSEEGSEKRAAGLPEITGNGVVYKGDKLESLADVITEEGRSDFEYTDLIAQLAALLKYRELIDTGLKLLENNPNSKIRKGLIRQRKNLNNKIDQLIAINESVFLRGMGLNNGVKPNKNLSLRTLSDVESHLVYNPEEHSKLVEAYVNSLKWNDELESINIAFEQLVGKLTKIDDDGNKVDANDGWNPNQDIQHVKYIGSTFKRIIKEIEENEDADDSFERAVELNYQNKLKAQHLDDSNAWTDPRIYPRKKKPVYDADGNQIHILRDASGKINRELAENETVDDFDNLWEYEDLNPDDPINNANRTLPTPEEWLEMSRLRFRETFYKMTGQVLPFTPEGEIERRLRALFEAARASGGFKEPPKKGPKKISVESASGSQPDWAGITQRYYETRNRLVPPQEIRPEQPSDDPQDAVIKNIELRYQKDKVIVKEDANGYHTTSQDYFIEQDGKIIRASRVHNVKPEPYIHDKDLDWIKHSVDALKSAESYDDVEDIVVNTLQESLGIDIPVPEMVNNKTNERARVALGFFEDTKDFEGVKNWWHLNYPDLLVYLRYINDNSKLFFETPTPESKAELNTTLENLAKAFLNHFKQKGPSILVGNIVDELARNFFGSDVLYNMTQTTEGMRNLFNLKTTDGRTYNLLYRGNFDAFSSLIRQLLDIRDYYTNVLGWKLTTLPFTLRAQFNDIGWVAGQTDMIGVDKNGRIHIIDFKTSKHTFGLLYLPNIQLTQAYHNDLKILEEKDFYTAEGVLEKSKKAKRVLRAIKSDGHKNIDIEWENGQAVISNKTRPFVSTPNKTYGLLISAYEDYSNQQTAYAEMLKANGFDVASIEILPFRCSYDYEFTELGKGIVRIDTEERMPLMLSSKMMSILDGVETRDDQVISLAREDLHNNIGHLQYRVDNIIEKISYDVFNELSDQGKLLYSDFIAEARNALLEAENVLYENHSKDLDVLHAQNEVIEDILSRFDEFLHDLRADYKLERSKAAQQSENESKRDLQKKREPQSNVGPAAGFVEAPNKKDSSGNTTRSNLNYRRVNGDPELSRATIAPNFIDDADISLYIDGEDIYADIQFEGHIWQRVQIDTKYNGSWIPNSKKLYDNIKRILAEYPDSRVVPVKATMTRTNGRILLNVDANGKLVYKNVTETDLFAGQDIYDIEFSFAYGNLGFVDNNNQIVTFDGNEQSRKPIGLWSNVKMASQPGTFIYKKLMPKNERKNSYVYVAIDRIKISSEGSNSDADFIVEAIKNPDQLDKPYYKEINGNIYNLHATPRQIINTIIPLIDNPQELGNFDSIIRDPNNRNVVYIMKRQDLALGSIGRGRFDLSTDKGIEDFKKIISTMSIAERHDILSSRLGLFDGSSASKLPFGGIKQFFVELNGSILSLTITDSIKFDIEDFKTVTSKSGAKRNGISGFAYYLKHGMLITQYAGMGSANVEIKDVVAERGSDVLVQPSGIQSAPPIGSISQEIDSSDIDALLEKSIDATRRRKPLSEEKARKHIAEILGDNVPVEFHQTFLQAVFGKAHVVGNCKSDAIILSEMGWAGVEYHEAFHRIFEMLVPQKERDYIYHKIAKRIGVDLYDSEGNENKEAFRLVAEYAADRYMEHMNHHMTDLKIPFITKIYNKIHDWISSLLHISDRELYKIFLRVNKGEFRNAKPTLQAINRFDRLFKELHCEIHGILFDNIVNRPMYDALRKNVLFCILQGQNVDQSGRNILELGKNINKETFLAGVEKLKKSGFDIFGDNTQIPTVGLLAMKEIYDKFNNDAIRDDIANDLSVISTDFVKELDDLSIEDALSDDVTGANIGEHTRSSYEFSRFSKTSSRVRFFFATIPDTKYERVVLTGKDGKQTILMKEVFATNEFGLPQYAPVGAVFNEFLNLFHDVDSISELQSRLEYFAKTDPLYNRLHKAINKILKSTYIVNDGIITRNSDQEALLVQLMNVIRSNKHTFDIARSVTTNNGNGMHRIIIQTTDSDYNAVFYPTQWNQMLVNGGTPIIKISSDGSLRFNNAIKNVENSFSKMADVLSHGGEIRKAENGASYTDVGIKEWLSNAIAGGDQNLYLKIKVNGKYAYYNNPFNPEQIEVVKDKIVQMLNMIGILINSDEFNYMLRNKYGSTDCEALAKMFNSTSRQDSMSSFLQFLKDVAPNGKLLKEVRISGKMVKLQNAFAKMAFVKDLANWKYQYRHSHDQLTVLATNNNKFYEISDNNYVSDIARMINKRREEFDELLNDPFNYFEGDENVIGDRPVYGSVILKELKRNDSAFITLRNFVGFKTDKRGDTGSDYFQISKREDYVSKATILEQGGIIMPTLSDKKTWLYVDGIKLPGLDYSNTIDDNGNTVSMASEKLGDLFIIFKDSISLYDDILSQDEEVIDQFISYAYSEYESIKKADKDLDQMEKNGTKSEEVANYYKLEQGARFGSLLGVWINTYSKDAQGLNVVSGEKFISFNNKKLTRKENIKLAEKYFFSLPKDILRARISRLLHKRLLKEILTCEELGLIKRIENSGTIFGDYENVGLNNQAIDVIYKSVVSKNGQPIDAIAMQRYKSLAVMIYLNDISNKAIMSGQEVERVFSGNPAFYKWKYDDNTGALVDRTVDELKRLGGVVSTGNNNFTELKDIPSKYLDENGNFTGMYVCAEVDNELIESPQIDLILDLMEYGEILTAAYNQEERKLIHQYRQKYKTLIDALNNRDEISQEDYEWIQNANPKIDEQKIREEVSKRLDSCSLEDLKNILDQSALAIAQRKAKESTDSYRLKYKDGKIDDGIDVADGAAYITDTMAEMLLRMNGNYSTEILQAFKILREEITSNLMQKYLAYLQIVTSVIGSQKYTAFGRRKHAVTGTPITYYNKMALFPIFKSIATGKMLNIYNKMNSLGIDMLMVNSAVKVGSQGSKPINWDEFPQTENEAQAYFGRPSFDDGFQFNTYEQKFIYLRKQLNTDPKEEFMMSMGTQMTKVVMSSLFDGREYTMQDGTIINGKNLRDDIMNSINELSNKGMHNIVTRFFKTDKDGDLIDRNGNKIPDDSKSKIVDEEKFAREIRLMMQTKDPDRNIIDALEIVEQKDKDGLITKHLRLPLNAISNSSWLESILISSINKKVVDIETPGAAFIQRSVWAMEGGTMFERSNGGIIGDEDLPKSINNGLRLLMINEEGSMDCVVSFDFIKKMFKGKLPVVPIKDKNRNVIWDLIPETDKDGKIIMKDGKPVYKQKYDKNGNPIVDKDGKPVYKRKIRTREMSFEETRNWLIKRGIIGPNATANIIGYRIPTQAQSSIHALRIVDIIPVVNDTIILPAEFTKITGSDFDIDKLFLSSIQYSVEREEGEDGKFHQIVSDLFKEGSSAYYQNKLLKDYLTVLLDWKRFDDKKQRTANILHRSIDNDTKLLKDIIKDLEENKSVLMEEPYGFYSLSTLTESKNDYITGKIGIGPFALNNNNHILTMMYHVRFKHVESGIMAALDLEELDRREDKNGESIMSWISALINAHVDIAKDPYISRLNVNPFTYNLVNLLVRTGLGAKTFYFTTLPIMKELAKAYINAGSLYMADPHKGKYKLQQEAIDETAEAYFEELGTDALDKIRAIKEGGIKNAKLRESINLDIAKMFSGDELIVSAKSNTVDKEQQLLVYLAYLQFDKYANALSNLVKYSKIDTKKHGKSVVEQMIYGKGYTKTFDILREDNLFDPTGLDAMLNDSYIATKTENAISTVREILSNLFIQSTPAFQGTVDKILKAIGREESLSINLVNKVVNALSAAIKSKFFVDTYVPAITDNKNYLHDLVSESQEYLDFTVTLNGAVINLKGDVVHNLLSYCNGGVAYLLYNGKDGKQYLIRLNVVGADPATNRIAVDKLLPPMYGKILIKGGKNTIYDRFMRLQTSILTDPQYAKLKSSSGDIDNRLLQMIVPGNITEYKPSFVVGEHPDTYETSKFIKLFNFVEDSGNTANYIIDGWEELLQYTDEEHPEAQKTIREFARDLVVYSFITSGDRGGFTKMFKYVPVSWREQSGYGQFIHDKLAEYSIGYDTDIDIDDVLLNNWYDNELVPTYYLLDKKTRTSNFMKYYTKRDNKQLGFPTILAALSMKDGKLVASIEPSTAPLYIKIPRRSDRNADNSLRRFTVYKMHKIAIGNNGIEYPVYIKVNQKGNLVSGGFIITEYGRSDNLNQPEYSINEEVFSKLYQASDVANHINAIKRTEPIYAAIVEGLNRAWNKEQERGSGITDLEINSANKNNNFDDSLFSDDAMNHCKH